MPQACIWVDQVSGFAVSDGGVKVTMVSEGHTFCLRLSRHTLMQAVEGGIHALDANEWEHKSVLLTFPPGVEIHT